MNKTLFKNSYYLIATIVIVISFLLFLLYIIFQYEKNIEKNMLTVATTDVLQITQNKARHVQKVLQNSKDYIKDIRNSPKLQKQLEEHLLNLITDNIKYAYLLYKDKHGIFRFLVDASPIEEKAMLNQKFDITSDKWYGLYKTKKPTIIQHTLIKKLSISYLVPIMYENNVELILVIDFSVDKLEKINGIIFLMKSGLFFILSITFILFIILIIQFIKYKNIKKYSFTDKLTGLYNRNYLYEIQDTLKLDEFLVAALDIDHFKSVNDTYGHDVGDIILREVGNILLHTIRVEEDIVIRYGGEEFVILIKTKSENTEGSLNVIHRILSNIKEHKMFINEEDYINITVSIGVNTKPRKSRNFLEAFKLADLALYEAKESGRDVIKIYEKYRV